MNHTIATSIAIAAAALFTASCNKGGEVTEPPEAAAQAPADAAPADAAPADEAAPAPASDEKIACLGINTCKGESQCDVEGSHECAGQNDCKGKGWIMVPQSECDEKGGTVKT